MDGHFTVTLPLIMKNAYVTGFWKTDQDVTLGLFYFIVPAKQLHSYITHLLWALLVLVDWFAFLEQVFRPCKVMTAMMGPMEGTTWEAWV